MSSISEYYDEFLHRHIRNHVHGNLREEAARRYVVSVLGKSNASSIAEIGCGVGFSLSEFAEEPQIRRALGVDISPVMIDAAQKLFGDLPGVSFAVSNLQEPPTDELFDVICLMDVYEHVPPDDRAGFHKSLAAMLSDTGCIALTVPSPENQDYLAENASDSLQIVDEKIYPSTLQQLCEDTGSQLLYYSYRTIWRPGDYVYALCGRPSTINFGSMTFADEQTALRRIKDSGPGRKAIAKKREQFIRQKLGDQYRPTAASDT